mmetsp:Transcript_440/g.1110  ORF Transcript_440/g.1110 Transcript_440/m.1110 type:complete len:213 (-) Transcript_440:1195-1833(-)
MATCLALRLSTTWLTSHKKSTAPRYGSSSIQGRRPNQEDRFHACEQLPGHSGCAFYAVYDGHGGHVRFAVATSTRALRLGGRCRLAFRITLLSQPSRLAAPAPCADQWRGGAVAAAAAAAAVASAACVPLAMPLTAEFLLCMCPSARSARRAFAPSAWRATSRAPPPSRHVTSSRPCTARSTNARAILSTSRVVRGCATARPPSWRSWRRQS